MQSFPEQNQPQGCLSHSRENTCKYASSCVHAFKLVLKQRFLRDSSEVPDWQLQNLCSFIVQEQVQQRQQQHYIVSPVLLELMKAWPLFPAILHIYIRTHVLTTPIILFSLKSFDHYTHNIITVMTDAATLEIASHQGKVVCVLYLLAPWSLKESGSGESGRWQGSYMQFPHLLQNGALLDHCLFNEQRIVQEWGCTCAVRFSGFPLLILLFSKSKILSCSHILHM